MENSLKNISNRIITFFVDNPSFYILLISKNFPFNNHQIFTYKNILNRDLILNNTSIKWNSDILKHFISKEDWEILSLNPSVFRDLNLIDEF